MQKPIKQLLLAAAFLYCGVAAAQTGGNSKPTEQEDFFQYLRSKTSLTARFHHSNSAEKKVLNKAETKKMPTYIVYVNWDEDSQTWTDTSEKYTITYADNGMPSQVILDLPEGDNGFPERIYLTDWIKMEDGSDEGFAYLFNGENYMFKSAIAKVYVAGIWANYQRFSIKLTPDNMISEELIEEMNGVSWANSQKTTFTYDQQKQNTEILNQEWKNGAWVNSYKNTYAYDINGVTTENVSSEWVSNAWEVQYGTKFLTNYNTSNQLTSIETYNFNSDQKLWQPQNRQNYTLNASGEITEAIEEVFSPDLNDWVKSIKFENIMWQKFDKTNYDAQPINVGGSDVLSFDRKYWNGSEWLTSGKQANQYNSAGFQTLSSFESFMDGVYKQVEKTETSYYTNNDIKDVKYFMLDSDSSMMHYGGYSNVNVYDADGDKTDEIFRTWDSETGAYANLFRTITTYSTITAGIQNAQEISGINIYPNPATTGTITLSFNNQRSSAIGIDIFDITGKNVLHTSANSTTNKVLDVSNFPKGLYFISINCDNKISKSRFVIQ